MPGKCATSVDASSISKQLISALGEAEVLRVARESRWLRRLRDISPLALVVACLSTLGASKATWIADILRSFNAFTGLSIRYKPFHNQLRKSAFPEFMRRLLERTLEKMARPVLSAGRESKLGRFRDILMHDGSSFALKDGLRKEWPGRFTTVSPAAVELHVTMSAFEDNPIQITLAPDKEAERALGPKAEELRDCLLLEDRGYEHRQFFLDMQSAGAFFIVRGNKAIRPIVRKARDLRGRRLRHLEGKPLSWEALPARSVDMDIEWGKGTQTYRGRLVALYKRGRRNEKTFVYLHTNLERAEFSALEVGKLYRLRWQVELLFKECKSHANLHRFDTEKSAIAEGLIWSSMLVVVLKRAITHAAQLAIGIELSTQRAASCAKHVLDDILHSLLSDVSELAEVVHRACSFLGENSRRAHPKRDRQRGRLSSGLVPLVTS
jgi:DDE family transposase